jgi:hypothetical protein
VRFQRLKDWIIGQTRLYNFNALGAFRGLKFPVLSEICVNLNNLRMTRSIPGE